MIYLLSEGTRRAARMKTGPNDASRCVVWAISMFFLIFILCFMYTYYFLLYYLDTKKARVGKDNENGPNDASRRVVGS